MRIFDIKGARKKLGDNKVLKGIDLTIQFKGVSFHG